MSNPFARPKPTDGPRATFGRLLSYLFENKPAMVVIIVLSILGAAASLAQPLLVNQVVTAVQQGTGMSTLVWALVVLVLVAGVLNGVQHFLLQRAGEGVVLSTRRKLIARILNLPISEFDVRRTGDLVSRVGSDTTLLRAVLTQGLIESIGGALTFVGAVVAMAVIDPLLLVVVVVIVIVAVVVVGGLSRRIRVASKAAQEKVGDLTAAVERGIGAVRTIRAAGATAREVSEVDAHATEAYRRGLVIARMSAFVVPVASIVMQVAFIAVLGIGGAQVAAGTITIATLITFILLLFMMIMPLGQALGAVVAVAQALGALGRIEEILHLPTEDQDDAAVHPAAAVATDDAITFEHVTFRYAATPDAVGSDGAAGSGDVSAPAPTAGVGEQAVLHDVSFSVPRGTRVALVGPSGAGKSTTLALIERFYDPTEGVIRLGGLDVRGLDRAELRAQIGYVEQDAPVLAGTIRANLLLGSPDAPESECVRVLEAVNLGDVLHRDPRGLDAQVGEDGVMLSGGERQRLAIARALLAAPPILLLDESTSSLDGVNEQKMRLAIDAVAEDRTLLVIAHRLSTVVDSDVIVVLEHGRVVGIGTHSELVQSTPLYRDLAKHQLLV
ncbi:ABC transporter ATP-binding protein [Curtobacterium sp. MCJR17_055]|uniref:ABC transporter ATP-binding protein n=1 Tax=unclassified Curtobacterium TaxID=257496 RepID=UPI000D84B9B1|nr:MULTISPECIES: ABC transporter ATP-binding protein [unclassified Curtobacterium]PYY36033.1 ABC transporter ATP-binding protein [Curtobacterium sp. MCBD17_029]PYY54865.1 ABC transporter ATP-binding protein [Curtobacterium sp. MCJR17_055]PYY61101.1 ABC transporter ATP-binding protein [Curtobacterium sp. MCPF17_015]WIB35323.1 ABC transporter ATP-binding protein [Curtobacterium sp. MCJR17_043]